MAARAALLLYACSSKALVRCRSTELIDNLQPSNNRPRFSFEEVTKQTYALFVGLCPPWVKMLQESAQHWQRKARRCVGVHDVRLGLAASIAMEVPLLAFKLISTKHLVPSPSTIASRLWSRFHRACNLASLAGFVFVARSLVEHA